MPLYTYKCENEKCEKCHLLDDRQRPVDDRNKDTFCECGEKMVRVTELNSNPRFRGTGWTPRFS